MTTLQKAAIFMHLYYAVLNHTVQCESIPSSNSTAFDEFKHIHFSKISEFSFKYVNLVFHSINMATSSIPETKLTRLHGKKEALETQR